MIENKEVNEKQPSKRRKINAKKNDIKQFMSIKSNDISDILSPEFRAALGKIDEGFDIFIFF